MTYIYALTNPDTNIERYVGKADDPCHRYQEHLRPSSLHEKSHKNDWIKSLLKQGKRPGLRILMCCLNTKCIWENCERLFIAIHRIRRTHDVLTNSRDGGDGGSVKGAKYSKKTRQGMSKSKKGKRNPNYGKNASEETKRKISEAGRGEKNHNTKFTEAEVLEIRRLGAMEKYTRRELARQLNIPYGTITGILSRTTWKYLPQNQGSTPCPSAK